MKKLYFLLAALFFAVNVYSAYLRNVPVDLKQPDGNIIHCFITGDEFHRRVHDKDNYTILQDPATGYYVYAGKSGEELIPTSIIVGKGDPKLLGLEPNLDIPARKMEEKRTETLKSTKITTNSQTIGKFYNLVIFIRFSDEEEFTDKLGDIKSLFNDNATGVNSVYNYYKEASYGQLEITSSFYPSSNTENILSYKDFNPRNFYTAWSQSNPIGYSNRMERSERELTLLENALKSMKSQIGNSVQLDGNNDGLIDNICFITKGSPEFWGLLLWPHASYLGSRNISINGKLAATYCFQIESIFKESGVGVVCHELFHDLGAPDLYHYNDNGISPVYSWDIMESNTNPPQHMSAYMKYRYGGWIPSIPEITESGTYYLKPLTSTTKNCFKIASPNSNSEYFVVEYRKKMGAFENSLPGEGLLVYRILSGENLGGNSSGPPDEVYIFRPQGTLINNGKPELAALSVNSGRIQINDNSDPFSFLSDGMPGGLDISNIGSLGDSISFTFKKCNPHKLAITSPNGGENFKINSKTNITWVNRETSTIRIDYSNDGKNWQYIDSLTNQISSYTNNYLWTIPDLTTQTAKIRISDSRDKTIYSESKNFFTISEKGQLFEVEPNNTAEQATQILLEETFEGEILNAEDVDYYKFTALQGDTVDVFANALNSILHGRIRVFSADGLNQWYGDGISEGSITKQRVSLLIPETGLYYIRYAYRENWGIFPNAVDPNRENILNKLSLDSISYYSSVDRGKYNISLRKFTPGLPEIKIIGAVGYELTQNSATLETEVITNGSQTCVSFEYGATNSYGNSIDAEGNCFQILSQSWRFRAPIGGLKPNTIYHCRIIAKNLKGTSYSPDYTFTTPPESDNWEKQIPMCVNFLPQFKENFNKYISINEKSGITIGASGVFKTTDNGKNWRKILDAFKLSENNSGVIFQNGTFLNENLGWIVGTDIYKTVDGGNSWIKQNKPTEKYLESVSFSDENHGIAVGYQGIILKTIDGGNNWTVIDRGMVNNQFYRLWAVQLLDEYIGYAVGDFGTSIKTVDGGNTWIKLETGEGAMFNNLYFIDPLNGYIIGDGKCGGPGDVIHTTDGGNSWQIQNNTTGKYLYGIDFFDKNKGIVCGTNGAIAITDNGGNTWVSQESGVRSVLYNVKYIDSIKAVIVGNYEIILTSKNTNSKELVIKSPVGSEMWDTGSLHDIIWQKNNVLKIHILYSIDLLNQKWDTIATNVPAYLNTYRWTIPKSQSRNCKIKIIASEDHTVISENKVPFTIKSLFAPIANAGQYQSVNEVTTVSLDGSASSDPDGDPLTYKWTAPTGITLSSTAVAKPTFTAPEVTQNTPYTFTLVVNDGTVDSPTDQVVITVKNVNKAPVANAGTDQSVNESTTVSLDGSASSDPDGNLITYKWTAPAGIILSSATAAKPTFTAPEVTQDTPYTFTLVVNDGMVDSPADQVVITVKNVNKVPVANAGVDKTVNEGTTVSLDGSASSDPDGNPLTYKWTAPTGITLSSTTVAKPTFTAPEVSANTNYTFSLIVNDGTVDSPVDQVVITVKNVNKVPVANAGVDKTVNEGTTVSLDGSASSDPDGNPLTYKWTAPTGITLSSTTVAKPTFTAPEVSANTNYTFSLIVNDGTVDSPVDQVVITVKNVNKAPVANAGTDQTVNEGSTATLDGSASSDPDGDQLTYIWTAPAGITLSSATSAKPTFTAPEVTQDTPYTFTLVVNDGTVDSPQASVNVTILNVIKVGVSTIETPLFKVYPNPTTGIFTVEFTQNSGKKTEVSVSNLVGAEVFRKEITDASKFQIDLSNQVSGIYMLKVVSGNQQTISKIVVRKE